jgi:hypothetical protein
LGGLFIGDVLFDFVPSEEGGSVETDFAFQNGKLRTIRRCGLQWKIGGILSLEFVSVVLYFVILNSWKGGVMSRSKAP